MDGGKSIHQSIHFQLFDQSKQIFDQSIQQAKKKRVVSDQPCEVFSFLDVFGFLTVLVQFCL